MGIVTVDIDVTKGPTKEQIEMLEKASKMPSTAMMNFRNLQRSSCSNLKEFQQNARRETKTNRCHQNFTGSFA